MTMPDPVHWATDVKLVESIARARVVAIAREWLGTPYHHRARTKGAGVDCGQLIAGVFEEAGLIPPVELEQYPHDWMLHRSEERFRATVERYTQPVTGRGDALPGDILLFQFGRCISHGAIVDEWPLVIHAHAKQGKVIRSSMDQEPELRRRYVGLWKLIGWS